MEAEQAARRCQNQMLAENYDSLTIGKATLMDMNFRGPDSIFAVVNRLRKYAHFLPCLGHSNKSPEWLRE